MSTELQTRTPKKYRLFELIADKGQDHKGCILLRREIRRQTGIQFETLSRWINHPADSTQSPISLENAVIIARILDCKPEELLTPMQIEMFPKTKSRVA